MIFYYTGSEFYNAVQNNVEKSIGGYLSSSQVPNQSLNNVFSDISKISKEQGLVETKAIVLKNTTGTDVTNVNLYQNYPVGVLCKIEWAAVSLVGGQKMEKIPNFRSCPYVGTFNEPNGAGNQILLSNNFVKNDVIGLCVRRTITLPDPDNAVDPLELEAYLNALVKKEEIEVILSYN